MALRINFFSPNTLPQTTKFHAYPVPTTTTCITTKPNETRTRVSVSRSNNSDMSDAELASDLATEVAKLNNQLELRREAMNKSREMLFTELCKYLALEEEELQKQWKKMKEDDKWVLVEGFVGEWGVGFHPLSARSVKEMVDEYLNNEDKNVLDRERTSFLFPGLKKFMGGFSQNDKH